MNEVGGEAGRKQRSEGEEQGRREGGEVGRDGGREQGRDGNVKGGTLRSTLVRIHYTVHKTTLIAAIVCETLVLQDVNSERVYKLCIVMRRHVLFDRWMT